MDRLDRYVARTVAGSYAAGLVFMALLFTLVNILLDLGAFLDAAGARGAGAVELLGDIARYYTLFLPIVFVTVAPFVSVIAGMFAVARHIGSNEFAPMLFTGRSTTRVLLPVLASGALSAGAMVACWEYVVPHVTQPLHEARQVLVGGDADGAQDDIVVRTFERGDRTLIARAYDHARRTMRDVSLLDQGTGPQDVVLTTAEHATWDPGRRDWHLTGGAQRIGSRIVPHEWLGAPDVEPDILWRLGKEGRETIELSYSEIADLRQLRPGRRDLVLAFHSHLTFPLANLVLLLLALPFAVHFERGGGVERVVFAVLLCGAYLVTDLTCQNLGRAYLHPVLAAWLPTILFGSVGVVFFGGIRS